MDIFEHARQPTTQSHAFITEPERPMAMLRECPAYTVTPLHDHGGLADSLGLGRMWLKDESTRMGLGSFKALGGAFAVAQILRDATQTALGAMIEVADLQNETVRTLASAMTFITASAGNHGLSVAAGARLFGAKAVIVLSETVPEAFAARLEGLGATVARVPGTYEDSVAHAIAQADANGWQLLADGSWPGYTAPPAIVMEGYTVLAEECRAAFEASGVWPTHVVLQAGVGGMASAIAAHIRGHWPEQPQIIVVEPEHAACLQRSIKAGTLTQAPGPVSDMGRLDCKDASMIAFEALRQDADVFVTISETEAGAAVALLEKEELYSTPSGAAGVAALIKGEQLGLDASSRCLSIISEGRESG